MNTAKLRIGLVLFPGLTQLDLTGPAEVLGRIPGVDLHLLWKDLNPVASDRGLRLLPTTTFADCPSLDVICVPGGPGQLNLMDDDTVLDFLRRVAPSCRLVTSVCTGSLVLAAAGLLRGYRATCHWTCIDQLSLFGALPVSERVVHDRNRLTGAGVTSGIDFALTLVADLLGEDVAKEIQLKLEYDPQPPYNAGSPKNAPSTIVSSVRNELAEFLTTRRAAAMKAAKRLEASASDS